MIERLRTMNAEQQPKEGAGTAADGAPSDSARRTMARWRVLCLAIAALALGCVVGWTAFFGDIPPSISPPAGAVLGGEAPFRFAVISDTRGNTAVFEDAMEGIKREKPAVILHAGDIAERYTAEQFEWVLHEVDEMGLTVPFCPVPGNHDVEKEAADPDVRYKLYRRAFGPRHYWFACANALFVAYDDSYERCTPDDLAWLDTTLAQHRDQYAACFVSMHVPPLDSRPGGMHCLPRKDADALFDVLTKHRVTAVFAGHLHGHAEYDFHGIPVYITGGAGESKAPEEYHHYLVCSVAADGSCQVERRDIPHRPNDDYPEYAVRTKFARHTLTAIALALVLAAGLPFGRLWRGTRPRT
jgi:Icc-related predicted phosphoesterase